MRQNRHPGEGRDPRTGSHGPAPRDPGLRRGDGEGERSGEEGFTLVELMVVIVIIGLLATIVIINVMPAADRAAATKARADIATLEQGIDLYRLDNQRYPTSEEGLQALVAGDYIRRLPNDPWNNPYRYAAPGREGRPFTISTWGADGREGGSGEDADIAN
ncbi:MAG TPA: type II secretion system major pseudopilin GspG [Allosphingosinicella sp.]|nr:type II secretion system major pseudopilin GspG [Allosphingosinicella sp.]